MTTRPPYSLTCFLSDFAPPLVKQTRSSRAVPESTRKLLDSVQPGDFIKVQLLGPPTIQFSGRFNSVKTDPSFWHSAALTTKYWEFPYRPAIVASVERGVVVHKGRKGINLSVYPLMMRKEGLEEFPEHMRSRFIPLSMLSIDSRIPQTEHSYLADTYIYNTCGTLTVSVDPYLIPVSGSNHFVLLVYLTFIVIRRWNMRQYIGVSIAHWTLRKSQNNSNLSAHLSNADN